MLQYPLRPLGGRGRGLLRSNGRVRWVSASALESPTSPRPSPPPGAEREQKAFRQHTSPLPRDKAGAMVESGGAFQGVADAQHGFLVESPADYLQSERQPVIRKAGRPRKC